jgi:hypothetical protein
MELLPGRYAVPDGAGVDVLRASTDQGIELVMTKKFRSTDLPDALHAGHTVWCGYDEP